MNSKALIYICIAILSTIGSFLGDVIGHGWLSLWSIILGVMGCFAGVWVGYKLGNM